nr:hypothetical protein [Tanacetum cinerariifolium]
MSNSEHSSVTYTSVPSPVKDYSDIGSLEVNGPLSPDYVPGLEEPEQAPLSLDYVPGPKEPEQAPPSPVHLPYVPELVYPEYIPPKDNRLRFASPTHSQEVGESSAAGAARQPDRHVHRRIAVMIEKEDRMAREA